MARPHAQRSRQRSASDTRLLNAPKTSKVGSLSISGPPRSPRRFRDSSIWQNPKPGNPYRLYLIADGFGVHVKLPAASVEADPETGQLTAKLEGLSAISPSTSSTCICSDPSVGCYATTTDVCGTYAVDSTFKPWDSLLPRSDLDPVLRQSMKGPNGDTLPRTENEPSIPSFNRRGCRSRSGDSFSLHL